MTVRDLVPLALLACLAAGAIVVSVVRDQASADAVPAGPAAGRSVVVVRTIDGRGVGWWHERAVWNRRQLNRLRVLATGQLTRVVWLTFAFECIHRFEGAWTDRGAPYWGGLQMDWDFMQTYGGGLLGRKGTADRWSPAEQVAAAIVGHAERGFWPWPTTARRCGLL